MASDGPTATLVSADGRLTRAFFARPVLEVAPTLLGSVLVHGGVALRLTEVEAYAGEAGDPGSHAFRGRTPRTEVMFGRAGHLYVYFTYGMHWCANIVCGQPGAASAVLLRAGDIVEGADLVAERRPAVPERDRARGPARLTRSLGLSGADNGLDACDRRRSTRFLASDAPLDPVRIRTGPRVGVSGPGGDGAAYPWRFWIDGEPTVSAYRPGVMRARRRS